MAERLQQKRIYFLRMLKSLGSVFSVKIPQKASLPRGRIQQEAAFLIAVSQSGHWAQGQETAVSAGWENYVVLITDGHWCKGEKTDFLKTQTKVFDVDKAKEASVQYCMREKEKNKVPQ